jgi:rhodanese-related sulfurtransferase
MTLGTPGLLNGPAEPSPGRSPVRAAVGQAVFLMLVAGVLTYGTFALQVRWTPPKAVRDLPLKEARARQAELVWVDVRNPDRFENAHMPGAVHFRETDAGTSMEAVRRVWKKGRTMCVYGEGIGSERAERVAKLLKTEFGTKEVYVLEGGWAAWPRP